LCHEDVNIELRKMIRRELNWEIPWWTFRIGDGLDIYVRICVVAADEL